MPLSLPLSNTAPDWRQLAADRYPPGKPVYMQGREEDLNAHLEKLEQEFPGKAKLDFVHAAHTVLIRRGVQRKLAYRRFREMWSAEGEHLLSELSARWLISACDTLLDCSEDDTERALAAAGSLFFNTIKLYETERFHSDVRPAPKTPDIGAPSPLFDGLTTFSIGRGDMIASQRQRLKALCASANNTHASGILLELLRRADRADTVFRRFAQAHHNEATRWWD